MVETDGFRPGYKVYLKVLVEFLIVYSRLPGRFFRCLCFNKFPPQLLEMFLTMDVSLDQTVVPTTEGTSWIVLTVLS